MNTKQPTAEKESPPAFVFEGFEPANTTPVPDVLFDELLTELSGTELKVMLYVIRRTLGFKKSSDGISLTQFTDGITTKDGRVLDKGCGIKKRSTVSKTLRDLIKKGCLESEKGKTDLGDDAVTIYRVHFKGVVAKTTLPSPQTVTTVVPKQSLPGSGQTVTTGSADLATHKKQLARNSVQETDRQEGTYGEFADRELPTPAQSLSQDIPYEPDWVKPTHKEYQDLQERVAEMQGAVAEHDAALKEDSYSHPQRQDSDAMVYANSMVAGQVYSAGAPVALAIGKTEQATQSAPKKKQGARKSTGRASAKAEPLAFTEQGQQVYGAWCSHFKSPPPAAEKTIICANALYPLLVPWCHDLHRTCAQLLGDIQKWMYATDKSGWYKRGITLCDVHRDFEKWQSAMTHESNKNQPKPTPTNDYSLTALMADNPLTTGVKGPSL